MTGLTNWKKYFLNFYKHWSSPPWQVSRQGDMSDEYRQFSENYLFVHNQAAYITLNLVSGLVHDEAEFAFRIQANLDWIRLAYTFYKDSVQTIMIFVHSNVRTGLPANMEFFDALYEAIDKEYDDGVRFIVAHRGSGRWSLQQNYEGVKNLDVINVPAGMVPPLKLVIQDGQPIDLQSNWM